MAQARFGSSLRAPIPDQPQPCPSRSSSCQVRLVGPGSFMKQLPLIPGWDKRLFSCQQARMNIAIDIVSVVVAILALLWMIHKDRQPPPDPNATFKKQFDILNNKLKKEKTTDGN